MIPFVLRRKAWADAGGKEERERKWGSWRPIEQSTSLVLLHIVKKAGWFLRYFNLACHARPPAFLSRGAVAPSLLLRIGANRDFAVVSVQRWEGILQLLQDFSFGLAKSTCGGCLSSISADSDISECPFVHTSRIMRMSSRCGGVLVPIVRAGVAVLGPCHPCPGMRSAFAFKGCHVVVCQAHNAETGLAFFSDWLLWREMQGPFSIHVNIPTVPIFPYRVVRTGAYRRRFGFGPCSNAYQAFHVATL